MKNNISLIDDETQAYRKKSKKNGQPRADHKHTYETVLLTLYFHYNTGEPKTSAIVRPTRVCTICGRIDDVDEDDSLYEVSPDPDVKQWMVWRRELSEKALSLPKWHADAFDKFATKTEIEE